MAAPLQDLRRRELACGVQVSRRPLRIAEAPRLHGGRPLLQGRSIAQADERRAGEEEEEAEEGDDPLYLQAVSASLKDAADKAQAEEEEQAQAIAAVKEMEAREAEVVILD